MDRPIGGRTAVELIADVRAGHVSVEEVVHSHLEALHRVHETTNAVAAFADDRALADARDLDGRFARSGPAGPLHGLPVTVKDWIDVEGFTCSGGAPEHRDRRPTADATVVARLRAAGAVVVAKTAVWRGGSGETVAHPLDAERTPGGSSTGEAVVVAMGASPLGIGSDSGGSIRLPAAWTGVFGLKPTSGRVPTTGHFPPVGALSDGRTQIGPLARTVDDLELALRVVSGPDWRDAGVSPVPLALSQDVALGGARFAVLVSEPGIEVTDEVCAAVEDAAGALEAAGIVRVAWDAPWLRDGMDITRRYWGRHDLSGAEVDQHLEDWDRLRNRYLEVAEHVDLLLTPAVRETAPQHRAITADDFAFTLPASLTGSPAIAVPFGLAADGMPLSVQLVGRPWEDHRLLAAARLLDRPGPAS